MSTSKRSGRNNNSVPVKTSERYNINGRSIPVYNFPAGTIINTEEYILYNSPKHVKGKATVLRKVDISSGRTVRDIRLFSAYHFGRTLYDIFSPAYGFIYTNDHPRFYFQHSKVLFTSAGGWQLATIDETANDFEEQLLSVSVDCSRIPNPHLKIRLGQTSDSISHRSILTISSGLNNYKTDVGPISNKSFHIVLQGPSDMVNISLKRADNSDRAFCTIETMELYDTILADTGGISTI
ncbi:MAG: hypothetical protein ABI741_00070 [Ferruginibacter sp.]